MSPLRVFGSALKWARISARDLWGLFYQLYERTYAKRNGSRGYLTEAFFTQIAETMPEQIAMAVAWIDDQPVACALYFFDDETLYGRYWGSVGEFSYLHFELCYYTGIEFAISRGIQRYDAGAQGEHKIVRGFEPIETHSLHWIKAPRVSRCDSAVFNRGESRDCSAYRTGNQICCPIKKLTSKTALNFYQLPIFSIDAQGS